MEFSKMADNMKDLSNAMLTQSKSNTRKAAIRADLDEELEMWFFYQQEEARWAQIT